MSWIYCGLVSALTILPPFADVPLPSQSNVVNKVTFDKIKIGMTPKEIHNLMGRAKADNVFSWSPGGDYSQLELWGDDKTQIWVEYEPTVTNGKVTRAFPKDHSTNSFAKIELKRVASKDECAAVLNDLIADAIAKMPLGYSVAISK